MSDSVHQLFLEEAQTLLQVMEVELLKLGGQRDLAALMRAAHTIKGSGAMVGLTAIPAIAQRLEDAFAVLLRQGGTVDAAVDACLLDAYGHLACAMAEDLKGGRHDEALTLTQAEPILVALDAWLEGADTVSADANIGASRADLDWVSTLFTGDVVAGLDIIATALQEAATIRLQVLRSQLDAFVGIGELAGLPGFAAIAQAGLTALDCRPSQSQAIGDCVLMDLRAAHAAVLAGDRQQGGQPSETLLSFGASLDLAADSQPTVQVLPPDLGGKATLWDASTEEAMLLALFDQEDARDLALPGAETGTLIGPLGSDTVVSAGWSDEQQGTTDHLETPDSNANNSPNNSPSNNNSSNNNLDDNLSEDDPAALDSALEALADMFPPSDGASTAFEAPKPDALKSDALKSDALNPDAPKSTASEAAVSGPGSDGKIPVSGQIRPVQSGLPKALIAKLEALLASAPPEIIGHRQVAKALRRPLPTPKQTKVPRRKPVRAALDRLQRLKQLFAALIACEKRDPRRTQQLQTVMGAMTQRFRSCERMARSLQDWSEHSHQYPTRPNAEAISGKDGDALPQDVEGHQLMQAMMAEMAQLGEAIQDMTVIHQQGHQVDRQKRRILRQMRNDLMR
ncbi:MAG: Hpt domain-containing protein [Cyanobacteria bacterium J06632_22]